MEGEEREAIVTRRRWRRSEYKAWRKKVKESVDESRKRVIEEFDRKLSEKFMD